MISLWVGAAALCAIAAAFIFWPLFYRKQEGQGQLANTDIEARLAENVRLYNEHISELEAQLASERIDSAQFEQLKLDQQRALLDDEASIRASTHKRRMTVGAGSFALLALLVIGAATLLYLDLGRSADLEIRIAQDQKQMLDLRDYQLGVTPDPARARNMIKLIQARLKEDPEQLQYWFFLARMHMELSDFDAAVKAYQEVMQRDQESAMVMSEAAQALFLRDGSKISPEVVTLVNRALAIEPNNTTALGLAGIDAFAREDYLAAITQWGKVVKITGPDAPSSQALYAGIERAAGLFFAGGGTQEQLDAARAGKQLTVSVSLAEQVKASPDQWVYVYARAWQGAKMPLAIARVKVSELPKQVLLTEAMAMSEAMTLASSPRVELVARLSQDGTATAKPGDWQGTLGPVEVAAPAADLAIEIQNQLTD